MYLSCRSFVIFGELISMHLLGASYINIDAWLGQVCIIIMIDARLEQVYKFVLS